MLPTWGISVRRVAPDLAKGLRRSFTLYPSATNVPTVGPGIIILDPDEIVSLNQRRKGCWPYVVDADWPAHLDLPVAVYAVAAAGLATDDHDLAAAHSVTRLRRGSGDWITVNVSPRKG